MKYFHVPNRVVITEIQLILLSINESLNNFMTSLDDQNNLVHLDNEMINVTFKLQIIDLNHLHEMTFIILECDLEVVYLDC